MKKPNFLPQTDVVLLRPWTPEDARWYVESRDEEVFRWTTEKRGLTISEAAEAIGQANDRDDTFCFAIEDTETNQLLGNIALVLEEGNALCGEIMFWLAPRGRGRGAATGAVRMLCHWAFRELNLKRIKAKTLPGNQRSARVVQRAGFGPMPPIHDQGKSDDYVWFLTTAP